MPKKDLPRLTPFQKSLCERCYPLVLKIEKDVLRAAAYRGRRLDEDQVRSWLHDQLLWRAGEYQGTDADEFEQQFRERAPGLKKWGYREACRTHANEFEDLLEDVHAALPEYDYEKAMDELDVVQDREEFDQVVWHGVSRRVAYQGQLWKWKQERLRVAKRLAVQ